MAAFLWRYKKGRVQRLNFSITLTPHYNDTSTSSTNHHFTTNNMSTMDKIKAKVDNVLHKDKTSMRAYPLFTSVY